MLDSDRPNNDQRDVEWRDGDRDRLGSDNEDVLGSRGSSVVENESSSSMAANLSGSAVVENGRSSSFSSMAANRLLAIIMNYEL